MVKSAEARQGNQFGFLVFSWFNRTVVRRVFTQSVVSPVFMVIADVVTDQSAQVDRIEHDHVIQQISATAPHPTFGNPVLPRAEKGSSEDTNFQELQYLGHVGAIFLVPVQDQIFRRAFLWKSFSQLLHDPWAGRMLRSIEMEDSPPVVTNDEEAVKKSERRSRHCEEIHCRNRFAMVLQES